MARASTPFTHLHTHSHYSLLEALPKIEELVETAKADGQTALALTDSGNLYGAIDFYKAAKAAGIKPILGVDVHVAPRSRHDKEFRIDDKTTRVVLLAKNEAGYRNLIHIVTAAHLEGFFNEPRVDREILERHAEGLIAILSAYHGEVATHVREGSREKAGEAAGWHKKIFGEHLYQEVTRHPEFAEHETQIAAVIALCRDQGIPLVAAHENYYLNKDDAFARELVNKIRTGSVLDREYATGIIDLSFISQKRANELFKDLPESLENNAKIAESCSVELNLGKWVFPNFPIPSGSTADQELRALAFAGLEKRNVAGTPDVIERIEYELKVISDKGYSPYFLVVGDLLRYAHENGIFTNIRGSVAGSIVTYLAGITNVNPLEYGLPFERFLNPQRPSAPDIDMDYADNRRDEIIEYARRKYGDSHVAQIGTFGTMLSRAAVRDVCRALGHAYAVGDKIAKMIPAPKQGFPVTIKKALEEVTDLAELYKSDSDAREILDLASKIEGNARHVGVHAAGVVISPTLVTDFVPIQRDPKGGKTITQYDMYAVEDAGLLKFDFLGLKNLSVLADSVARVQQRLNIAVDIDHVPLDDPKTFGMLSRGETLGVFQFAGSGMTSYLVNLKPTTIHDLNAMVALYRPGPMAFIPNYIERKRNPLLVTYLDPRMETILKNSYGIITYQDDVLYIAIQLAGYTWLEADKFRKAMGKKIPEEMAAQKEHFTNGCIEHGMHKDVVQKLWEQIETFAAYGFNKAHAASYGNLAYKTAYMKANYPVDYMAAVLTADSGDVEKIAEIVAECTRMGISVLPPDVNESRGDFTVVDDATIRFGLHSIKNFGEGVADEIIKARDLGGTYTTIADFCSRVESKSLNRKGLESLIKSGALDALGERGRLLANIETLLQYRKENGARSDITSLFGAAIEAAALTLMDTPEASMDERLSWEKELLGLYVSGHPLDKHREKLERQKIDIKMTKEKLKGVETVIAGFVESAQVILTKNGERMSFLRVSDYSGDVEAVAFPRILKEFGTLLAPGQCIMLKGKISDRKGEPSFVVDKVKAL